MTAPEGETSGRAWTPGPWKWWTSNSWRRLKRDDRGITQNVLEPYVCRDGCPDLSVSDADMALIAAAPELFEALEAVLDCAQSLNPEMTAAYAKARSALSRATATSEVK